MTKLIAILNVVAWLCFWTFGYLAISGDISQPKQMTTAALVAALGGIIGTWTLFQLVRHAEATGYAKRRNRADRSHLEMEYNEESS
ncbi:hypothetical protein NBRC116594_23680 [Shimia sp. NS0008-38b]|uniref:hypothetical protein n=1 Tax=Shimia sp. NS0008-38b TaxID=3127653 RepID=UPI00310B6728